MEISQALEAADGSEVTVSGFLIADKDGNTRLCSVLLESSPPQCGGDRINLLGFDASSVPNLKRPRGRARYRPPGGLTAISPSLESSWTMAWLRCSYRPSLCRQHLGFSPDMSGLTGAWGVSPQFIFLPLSLTNSLLRNALGFP